MTMLRSSQCESVPFEHDVQGLHLSRSVVDTCTKFLACMVDTQDYVCQLKNTYVKELWPKFCGEMTELNSKVIGLEKELADCKKEKEESQRYYVKQFEKLQVAKDGQRSHLVREVESPDHCLIRAGRCEPKVDSERALEREASNHAANVEVLRVEHEKQNQLLSQKIEACSKSNSELSTTNEDLRKLLQIQTNEIEELQKALELARLKQQIREQQRSLQEDSEDRYKRQRRLSLKKQRNSQSKSGSPFGPWRGEQGVEDDSLTDLQPVHDPGLLQSVPNVQSNAGELNHSKILLRLK